VATIIGAQADLMMSIDVVETERISGCNAEIERKECAQYDGSTHNETFSAPPCS